MHACVCIGSLRVKSASCCGSGRLCAAAARPACAQPALDATRRQTFSFRDASRPQPIPAVLEIPSKDSPYDPNQDSLLQRVKHLLGMV